jgi:hypothetical protein
VSRLSYFIYVCLDIPSLSANSSCEYPTVSLRNFKTLLSIINASFSTFIVKHIFLNVNIILHNNVKKNKHRSFYPKFRVGKNRVFIKNIDKRDKRVKNRRYTKKIGESNKSTKNKRITKDIGID